MSKRIVTDCEGFYRRDFLKLGTAGLCGLTLPDLLRLEAKSTPARKANSVIMVWLGGGPATIDMWDLRPEAPDTIRGEFKPIASSAADIQISECLPLCAKVMDKAALVRSVAHTIPDHGRGTVWMMTGNKPTPALQYPSLGSIAAKLLPAEPGVPPYVSFARNNAGNAGYLGTAYNPFTVEGTPGSASLRVRGVSLPTGFSLDDLENRNQLIEEIDKSFRLLDQADAAAGLDKFHQQALDILRADKTKKAFDLASEASSVRNKYGTDAFSQAALAARRLIQAGVRFVTISQGGYDTHGNNFRTLRQTLLPRLDRTLSALVEDLADHGLLKTTIVYCVGEFGRTPRINRNSGRDHWARSMAVFLAGGGIRPGYAHGATDTSGLAPSREPCTPDDVAATIFHCLGIDGHHELMSSSGRPLSLFREGKVIEKLLA